MDGVNLQTKPATVEFPQRHYISDAEYARGVSDLKPITKFYAELARVYEIVAPVSKVRFIFRCVAPGWVKVKYKHRNGYDCFDISGKGSLELDDEITAGMNEGKNG